MNVNKRITTFNQKVDEIFQSGLKWWTDHQNNVAVPRAMLLAWPKITPASWECSFLWPAHSQSIVLSSVWTELNTNEERNTKIMLLNRMPFRWKHGCIYGPFKWNCLLIFFPVVCCCGSTAKLQNLNKKWSWGNNLSLWSQLCVFVLAEHTDRGVPYGSRMAVWRGLFQQWCFSLNKWCSWSSPLSPGWGTGAAEGNKGLFAQLPSTSDSQLIWKGRVIVCPGPLWLLVQCQSHLSRVSCDRK